MEAVVGVAVVSRLVMSRSEDWQQRVLMLLLRCKGDDGRSSAADSAP